MKAGKLVHTITIERSTSAANEYGTPEFVWDRLAKLRAEIVQRSTEEFIRAQGAVDDAIVIFRTRFFEGIANGDRVSFGGAFYDIVEVAEIGRRKWLELRCRGMT